MKSRRYLVALALRHPRRALHAWRISRMVRQMVGDRHG